MSYGSYNRYGLGHHLSSLGSSGLGHSSTSTSPYSSSLYGTSYGSSAYSSPYSSGLGSGYSSRSGSTSSLPGLSSYHPSSSLVTTSPHLTSGGSRYTSRYGSSSDVPSSDRYSGRDRPSSYSEYSRSAPALDTDFKKLYDEEKLENERLRKELEQTKRELRDAKNELDRLMKKDAAPAFDASEKRERRALERKVSEMEEELKKFETLKADFQRLKDENGALIRVISKLSK